MKLRYSLALMLVAASLSGCIEWDNTEDLESNDEASDGSGEVISPFIYSYSSVGSGSGCISSGVRFRAGKDLDNNLFLEGNEVVDAMVFCDSSYFLEYGGGQSFGINMADQTKCPDGGYSVSVVGRSETVCRTSQGRNYVLPKRIKGGMMLSVDNYRASPGEDVSFGALTPRSSNNLVPSGYLTSPLLGSGISFENDKETFEAPSAPGDHTFTLTGMVEDLVYEGSTSIAIASSEESPVVTDGSKVNLGSYEMRLMPGAGYPRNLSFTNKIVDARALFNRINVGIEGSYVVSMGLELSNLSLRSPKAAHDELVARIERNTIKQNWKHISETQLSEEAVMGVYEAFTVDKMTPTEIARRFFVASLDESVAQTFVVSDLPVAAEDEELSGRFNVYITTKVVGEDAAGVIIQVGRSEDAGLADFYMERGAEADNIQPTESTDDL